MTGAGPHLVIKMIPLSCNVHHQVLQCTCINMLVNVSVSLYESLFRQPCLFRKVIMPHMQES